MRCVCRCVLGGGGGAPSFLPSVEARPSPPKPDSFSFSPPSHAAATPPPGAGVASALRDGRIGDALRHAAAHRQLAEVYTPLVVAEAPAQQPDHMYTAMVSLAAAAMGAYLLWLT